MAEKTLCGEVVFLASPGIGRCGDIALMATGLGEVVAAGLPEGISACFSILSPSFFFPMPNKRRFFPVLFLSVSDFPLWLLVEGVPEVVADRVCSGDTILEGVATALMSVLLRTSMKERHRTRHVLKRSSSGCEVFEEHGRLKRRRLFRKRRVSASSAIRAPFTR